MIMERRRSTDHQRMGQLHQTGGSRDRNWAEVTTGVLVAAAGVYLAARGMQEHTTSSQRRSGRQGGQRVKGGIHVDESITVNRPVGELYRFWRNLENLPRIMRHLESVTDMGGGITHWIAKAPAGTSVEWDAEIIEDVENSRIVWRSVGNTPVPNEGSVTFNRAPSGSGSQIHVSLQYEPPLGQLGAAVARMLGEEPGRQIAEDLKRYKNYLESGDADWR
jgi:uncharacterized membrane protein